MLEGPTNLDKLLDQHETTDINNATDTKLLRRLGRLHLRNGSTKNAENIFKQILTIDENDIQAVIELGICQTRAGNFEDARFSLERALELDPKLHTTFLAFSKLCEATGNSEQQVSYMMRAANSAPQKPEVRVSLAELLHRYGDLSGAITQYKLILQKYPTFEAALFGLGTIQMKNGKLNEAIQCYFTLINNNPGALDAQFNVGSCLFRQKKYSMAVRHLKFSMRSEKVKEKAMYLLAQCYSHLQELDQAIVMVENLVEDDEKNTFYQNFLAELYDKAGEPDLAKEIFKMLAREYPNRPEYIVKLITTLIKLNKLQQAEQTLNVLFKHHPGHIEGHRILGEIHLAAGRYKAAIEEFDRTLMLNENFVASIHGMANAYHQMGDASKEYEYLERAYQYNETAELALRLGELEKELSMPTSLERFKRVKELEPYSNHAKEAEYYLKHLAA